MTPMQSFRDSALYPRGGNTYLRSGWERLEQSSNWFDLRGRDLSVNHQSSRTDQPCRVSSDKIWHFSQDI